MSNKRYYTNVVPTSLYFKLLDKGMNVNLVGISDMYMNCITFLLY